jgi:TonB family protein
MNSKKISVTTATLALLLLTSLLTVQLALADTKDAFEEAQSVVKAVAPNYPPLALAARVSGSVILEAFVDLQGKVGSVRILEGPNLLRAAAENASKQWVFHVAASGDKPRTVRLTFTFTIMPEDTPSEELLSSFMPPNSVEVKEKLGRIVQNPNVDPSLRTTRKKRPSIK